MILAAQAALDCCQLVRTHAEAGMRTTAPANGHKETEKPGGTILINSVQVAHAHCHRQPIRGPMHVVGSCEAFVPVGSSCCVLA